MKKIWMLVAAAFLITGVSYAHGGDKGKKEKAKKTCSKGGKCCDKDAKAKEKKD